MPKKKRPKRDITRLTWERKPMTQVKQSDKRYNRKKTKQNWKHEE